MASGPRSLRKCGRTSARAPPDSRLAAPAVAHGAGARDQPSAVRRAQRSVGRGAQGAPVSGAQGRPARAARARRQERTGRGSGPIAMRAGLPLYTNIIADNAKRFRAAPNSSGPQAAKGACGPLDFSGIPAKRRDGERLSVAPFCGLAAPESGRGAALAAGQRAVDDLGDLAAGRVVALAEVRAVLASHGSPGAAAGVAADDAVADRRLHERGRRRVPGATSAKRRARPG